MIGLSVKNLRWRETKVVWRGELENRGFNEISPTLGAIGPGRSRGRVYQDPLHARPVEKSHQSRLRNKWASFWREPIGPISGVLIAKEIVRARRNETLLRILNVI